MMVSLKQQSIDRYMFEVKMQAVDFFLLYSDMKRIFNEDAKREVNVVWILFV